MAREIVEKIEGRYYAKGRDIFKDSNVTKYDDGSSSMSLAFKVCTVDEYINGLKGKTAAEMIADALNAAMIPTIEHYSDQMSKTAFYVGCGKVWGLAYVGLKLTGEAGEFSDKIGKMIRDDHATIHPETLCRSIPMHRRDGLLKELGDVLWYVNEGARALGSTLREVAEMNIAKLKDRKERGKLSGSGDER